MMTSRERLAAVLKGEIPDCVPVAPDTSNMIPCRLTGKPFWDIYLYQDPPLWLAYINCVKHFGFDSLMDGYVDVFFEELGEIDHDTKQAIISENEDRIITRFYRKVNGKPFWTEKCNVYFRANPPVRGIHISKLGISGDPVTFKDVVGILDWPKDEGAIRLAKKEMGDHGLIGTNCGTSLVIKNEEEVYDFAENPEKYYARRDELLVFYKKKFELLMKLDVKPDFIATGASGSLIWQSVNTFRELALPIVKMITKLAKEQGIPTHIHSCGPEAALIKICAEETDLTVIDPLEMPPAGDSVLKELKQKYGDRLVLKGNLHTTNTMLQGTQQDVRIAAKQAILDGAQGGRFILSTGDQCGRDTPDENILAMIETARTFGRYKKDGSVYGDEICE